MTLGGDSVIANIVSVGFSMALFRWTGIDDCEADDFSLGDVQMRVSALAFRRSGPGYWFGLTPFVRILVSMGTPSLIGGTGYFALLEPGIALGYNRGIFSFSVHLAGIAGFADEDNFGAFLSHITLGVRPLSLLAIIANLEVGYGSPYDHEGVPVAITIALRLFLGRTIGLDFGSRIAVTEIARYSDANAAAGLWSLGLRLSIVWSGLGRP